MQFSNYFAFAQSEIYKSQRLVKAWEISLNQKHHQISPSWYVWLHSYPDDNDQFEDSMSFGIDKNFATCIRLALDRFNTLKAK